MSVSGSLKFSKTLLAISRVYTYSLSCDQFQKLNKKQEAQRNTYNALIKGDLLVGRGWTSRATLSQESSEPVSPQGVCVGTRV